MSVQTAPKPVQEKEKTSRRIAFSQKRGKWDVQLSPYLYISPFFILFAITGLSLLLTRLTFQFMNGICCSGRENSLDSRTT